MKIALACQSILLEKSLEIFLKNYLSSYKQCDFVISDKRVEIDKPLFFISTENSDLNVPFLKSSLILSLEKFHKEFILKEVSVEIDKPLKKINIKNLEEKISNLTDTFRDDLIGVIKEYYEE